MSDLDRFSLRRLLAAGNLAAQCLILGRNLGREGESLDVIRLDELDPGRVDMLTLVLIGNSQTRLIKRGMNEWVYTPRGYSSKLDNTAALLTKGAPK